MNSTAVWENEESELANAAHSNGDEETAPALGNITNLKELTSRLFREVQSIGEGNKLSLENGLDFYEEVSHFEIDLIKRALLQTGGHQGQAARLLNLKMTTLNSKIKHYNIRPSSFANGRPLAEASEMQTRQHA